MSVDLPIVIVGAGAAGLMAAIFAARHGRPVLLLERTSDGGRKILISGGGRCNILPAEVDASRFITASSPHTLRNILKSWPLSEQCRFFEEEVGLKLVVEEETGKMFPVSNRARDVRDGLLGVARQRGAEIRFNACLSGLEPAGDGKAWRIKLHDGSSIAAGAVVMASGGLSIPQTGSDGTGLASVQRLGHTVHETYPALTPLTQVPPRYAKLAGVSVDVALRVTEEPKSVFRGGFLFTHRGYSGPSVLNLSHLAVRSKLSGQKPISITVQWSPLDADAWEELFVNAGGSVESAVRRHLPARLVEMLLREANIETGRSVAQLRREERSLLIKLLARFPLPWTGDEGYQKAEVTGGGVSLGEIDPRTMGSRIHRGLFLCGEMLDAFGPIGGYNFLWAWVTGRLAGLGAGNL